MNVGYALGEAETRALLQHACAATGLSADGARLLRLGSNAVYRLTAPVVVRIARPDADPGSVRRTVAVARWLRSAGYPAVRATDADQPVIIDGHAVTFWQAISDDGERIRHDHRSCRGHSTASQAHRAGQPAFAGIRAIRERGQPDSRKRLAQP